MARRLSANPKTVAGYVTALAAVAGAVVIRWLLDPVLAGGSPFLLFALAVMVAAFRGGRACGLFATALGGFLGAYSFLEPRFTLALAGRTQFLELVLFVLVGTGTSMIAGRLRQMSVSTVESERRFRLLSETVPQLIWTSTANGECDYLNARWAEYTGTPVAEQLGFRWTARVHPDDRQPMMEAWLDAVKHGTQFDTEFRIQGKDGTYRCFKTRATPLDDGQGHVTKWFGANTDIEELRRSEQAIRQSEAQLRALSDNVADSFYLKDKQGRLLLANQALLLMLGKSEADVVGKTDAEFITDAVLSRKIAENDRLVMESGETLEVEEAVDALQGRRIFLSKKTPWRDAEGRVIGIVGVSRDITERKVAEQRMQQWQRAFEQSELGISLVDPETHTFQSVNAAYARERGYSREEMAGQPVSIIYSEQQLDELARRVREADEKGNLCFEIEQMRRDGTRFPVMVDVTTVRDEFGRAVSRISFVQNLTERKRAEQELEQQRERLALAQEAARFGSFDWNLETNQTVWSEELQQLYGFAPGEFESQLDAWVECLLPEEREMQVGRAMESARTGNVNDVFRIRRKDTGEVRWMEARGRVFFDGNGDPVRVIGFNIDITERKKAEDEIRRLNLELEQRVRARTSQLEAANRELEAFSYSVSHDLRTPLRGIDGWSLALVEDFAGELPEQAQQYLSRVRAEAQRMGRLIDDLLQLSRITRAEMSLGEVDLSALAQKVAAELHEAQPDRPLQFVIEPGLRAPGDPRLLEIAFVNLLGNAVKFTGRSAAPLIQFGLARQNGVSAFYVRDNGVGFDMAYGAKLFGAFQRLHKITEFPGTGVGLATVQRVIRRHGGRIWAEAKVNQGATFYFTIGTEDAIEDHPSG